MTTAHKTSYRLDTGEPIKTRQRADDEWEAVANVVISGAYALDHHALGRTEDGAVLRLKDYVAMLRTRGDRR